MFNEDADSDNDKEGEEVVQDRYAYIIVPVKMPNTVKNQVQNKKLKPKKPYKQTKVPVGHNNHLKNYQGLLNCALPRIKKE